MAFEQYQIKLGSSRLAVVELAEAVDRDDRFDAVVRSLRELGASPLTVQVFALPPETKCSVANVADALRKFVRAGDQILLLPEPSPGGRGTVFVYNDKKEGVSVAGSMR